MSDLSAQVRRITWADHHNPFEVLGPHALGTGNGRGLVIRAFEPGAKQVHVIATGNGRLEYPMKEKYERYFFECELPDQKQPFAYELRAVYEDGAERTYHDPYAFDGALSDVDLYLFSEGSHMQIYEKLGAHPATVNGVEGVYFAVWAPNARKVSVIGGFNVWDGRRHPMRVLGTSGVWELFIPGLKAGDTYKYEIKSQHGHLYQKVDPYAFAAEQRPATGSVVADLTRHRWGDAAWLERRRNTDILSQPVSFYEVHLGSWMRVPEEDNRFLTYRELAPKLAAHVKELGFTHIELMPVAEHPLDISWGYQVLGYYAPTARYGSPEDFMFFVDHMHQNGIGVIMDWVPAHFPRDAHGLSYYDGTFLYEHPDGNKREHKDWGTLIFNYGRNEVRNFLIANALFWLDKYHLDGLRVDAVASMLYLDYSRNHGEWTPNEQGGRENLDAIYFLRRLNEAVFERFDNVMMVAEESTSWGGVSKPTYLGGLGFNLKWNMGWMNDFLTYMSKESVHRKYHQDMITFALLYAFHENFVLVLSHDEVVHGKQALLNKMPGDVWQKFANLRALLAFMYGHPGKKLLFQGTEIGMWDEWQCDKSLDWHLLQYEPHHKLKRFVADMNAVYRQHPALWDHDFGWETFEWIDFHDRDSSVVSFIRWSKDWQDCLVFVCNFTPIPRHNYRVGVPFACEYERLLDTDAAEYWGSDHASYQRRIQADDWGWQGKAASVNLTLPPLATLVLKPKLSCPQK